MIDLLRFERGASRLSAERLSLLYVIRVYPEYLKKCWYKGTEVAGEFLMPEDSDWVTLFDVFFTIPEDKLFDYLLANITIDLINPDKKIKNTNMCFLAKFTIPNQYKIINNKHN